MVAKITTGFASAGALVIPGASCKLLTIQNNGTAKWRLSFDGGGTSTGNKGTDPTANAGNGNGYLLAPGQQWVETLFQAMNGYSPKTIVAIVDGAGTLLLDISTDDKDSTAPGHA